MQSTIAPYLLSTYKLINRAFPHGIEAQAYFPLLALLYEEMSDRNLAQVLADYTGKDYHIVLNDVYSVNSTNIPSPEAIEQVKQHLLLFGYEDWLAEE
jgi:diketogulonate reductase-like aldo/keto reductase